jgi:cytochrome c oxidase subunit III
MNLSQSEELRLHQSSVAMTVALISWGMLFATMFLGYFLVRFNAPVWPPVEIQDLPQLLPFLSTLIMGLSSLTYHRLENTAPVSLAKRKVYWLGTIVLGILFLLLQWKLWGDLKVSGILVSDGMVPSMVYAFTWLHAAHIVLGLCALLWPGYYLFLKPTGLTKITLLNVGKFWHFLGVVWLLMYLMIFVL